MKLIMIFIPIVCMYCALVRVCVWGEREREEREERERERDRGRDRERERQTDRQTEREQLGSCIHGCTNEAHYLANLQDLITTLAGLALL